MQEPYKPNIEHDMLCPNCGSHNVSIDESKDVKGVAGENLIQYSCGDCKSHFIPAMTEADNSAIYRWSEKMRVVEGMNEGKKWSKPKTKFIIITPKKKN